MRPQTKTFEDLMKIYKAFSLILIVIDMVGIIYLPKLFHENESIARAVVFVCSVTISNGLMKMVNKAHIMSYNELLEKEVYQIQNALKDHAYVEPEDLDVLIKAFTQIRDAHQQNDDKKE